MNGHHCDRNEAVALQHLPKLNTSKNRYNFFHSVDTFEKYWFSSDMAESEEHATAARRAQSSSLGQSFSSIKTQERMRVVKGLKKTLAEYCDITLACAIKCNKAENKMGTEKN